MPASQRSNFLLCPVSIDVSRKIVPPIRIYKSRLNFGLYSIGSIILLIDKTSRMLKILEPITFPIAISLFFFAAATMDVTNSGSDVPAAIMVNPIIFSLTPKLFAMFTLFVTTN